MPPEPVISYASPATRTPRRWCRAALASAGVVLVTLAASGTLLALADENVLPQHFLCCKHPEVTLATFVVLPLAGAALGAAAVVRLAAARPRLKGWWPAVAGVVLNGLCAAAGAFVFFALKA